ncbi:MAG: hypothetical protein PWQ11_591 [Candidatus Diapherotrites archaeon]|nr:hypothetical protein [Candidatus Diapherotrites archaeon]
MAVDVNVDVTSALSTVEQVAHVDPMILLAGIGLIALAIFFIFFLKRVIVNSILGLVAFAVLWFMGIKLPFLVTLIVSIIFGLAGVGTMLILYYFGLLG